MRRRQTASTTTPTAPGVFVLQEWLDRLPASSARPEWCTAEQHEQARCTRAYVNYLQARRLAGGTR